MQYRLDMLQALNINGGNATLKQFFFVLYNPSEDMFYVDNQFGYTADLLIAERYTTPAQADEAIRYFKSPDQWVAKEVTVSVEL